MMEKLLKDLEQFQAALKEASKKNVRLNAEATYWKAFGQKAGEKYTADMLKLSNQFNAALDKIRDEARRIIKDPTSRDAIVDLTVVLRPLTVRSDHEKDLNDLS